MDRVSDIPKTRALYARNLAAAFGCGFGTVGMTLAIFRMRFGPLATNLIWLSAISFASAALKGIEASRKRDARKALRPLMRLTDRDIAIDYSIVIPTYNRPQQTLDLLHRLDELALDAAVPERGEIIVVNDGSTDATATVVGTFQPRSSVEVRLINQTNLGHSTARNTGVMNARAPSAICIDSDCVPDDGWLRAMLDSLSESPRSLIFGTVWSDRRALFPIEQSPAGMAFVTASFGMNVDAFLELGGLDTGFRGILEDRDFGLRVESSGVYTCVSKPAVTVWHPIRTVRFADLWKHARDNRFEALLANRHGTSVRHFLRNRFYGGAWFGNFPTSIVGLSTLLAFGVQLLLSVVQQADVKDGRALRSLVLILIIAYGTFAAACAIAFRRPILTVPRYVAALFVFAVGSTYGRIEGSIHYGVPLV